MVALSLVLHLKRVVLVRVGVLGPMDPHERPVPHEGTDLGCVWRREAWGVERGARAQLWVRAQTSSLVLPTTSEGGMHSCPAYSRSWVMGGWLYITH